MSLTITADKQQALSFDMQMALLAMPGKKRYRILKELGRHERAVARQRIKRQTDVAGEKFKPRSDGKKGQMLRKMGRTLDPVVKNDALLLKHKNAAVGQVAAFQQAGGIEQMTASKMAKRWGTPDYEGPCTKKQAQALRKAGYKIRKGKGGKYRRATLNEIMDNMTLGQAGLVLRLMRGNVSRRNWDIPVPPRAFLGDSVQNVQRQLVKSIEQINKRQRGY